MRWRRVDPVHAVDALLLIGTEAPRRLAEGLAGKPAFMRGLPTAIGENWAALFARPLPDEELPALPRLPGARALYQALPGWWFPVGSELSVPQGLQAELLRAFASVSSLAPPLIVVPRFGDAETSRDVDVYQVHLRETAEVA